MTFIGLKTETLSNKPIEKPVEIPAEVSVETAEEQPAEEKPSTTKGGGKK